MIGVAWTRFAAFRDPVLPTLTPDPCLERCAMCAAGLTGQQHTHLVAKETAACVCVCHACYHVFFVVTNGHSHRHSDDSRYYYFRVFRAGVEEEPLNLPTGLTFVFRTPHENRLVTWSPTPGGAIEMTLPDTTWTKLLEANPGVGTMRPLRDALLLRHTPPADDACLLLPSDVCFDLIRTVTTGCHNTLTRLQQLNAAMEDLWARATATARPAPRHLEAPRG